MTMVPTTPVIPHAGPNDVLIRGALSLIQGVKSGIKRFQGDIVTPTPDEVGEPTDFEQAILDQPSGFVRQQSGLNFLTDLEIVDAAQKSIQFAGEANAIPRSPLMDLAQERAAEGDFKGMLEAIAADPGGVIGFLGGESIGRGPDATLMGFLPILGSFLGSMSVEQRAGYTNAINKRIIERGGSPGSLENVVNAFSDEELLREAYEEATTGAQALAATEAGVELLTAGLAKFIPDGVVRVATELGSEVLGESAGEVARQAATGEEINLTEAALEGIATTGQSLSTVLGTETFNALTDEVITEEQLKTLILGPEGVTAAGFLPGRFEGMKFTVLEQAKEDFSFIEESRPDLYSGWLLREGGSIDMEDKIHSDISASLPKGGYSMEETFGVFMGATGAIRTAFVEETGEFDVSLVHPPTTKQKRAIFKQAKEADRVIIEQLDAEGQSIRYFNQEFPTSRELSDFLSSLEEVDVTEKLKEEGISQELPPEWREFEESLETPEESIQIESTSEIEEDVQPVVKEIADEHTKVVDPASPMEAVGLSHSATEGMRILLERTELSESDSRGWGVVAQRAVDEINLQGKKADRVAVAMASSLVKNQTGFTLKEGDKMFTDVEHGMLLIGLSELVEQREARLLELEAADLNGDLGKANQITEELNILSDEIMLITAASDRAGSELGRAFNFRKAYLDVLSRTPEGAIREARFIKGGSLTAEQEADVLTSFEALEKGRREVARLYEENDKLLVQREQEEAETTFRNELRQKVTEEQLALLLGEREEIKSKLREMGVLMSSLGGVNPQALWETGKLLKNMIKEGKLKSLDELVTEAQKFPGLERYTPLDIYKALNARKPRPEDAAKKELKTRLQKIKKAARVNARIEKAAARFVEERGGNTKGIESNVVEMKRILLEDAPDDQVLQTAMEALVMLQDAVRKEEYDAVAPSLRRLNSIVRLREQEADIRHQLETGEYKTPVRKVAEKTKLDGLLQQAKVDLEMARRDYRAVMAKLQPFFKEGDGRVRKGFKVIGETTKLSRQLLAMDVLSAALRQGLVGVTHPKIMAGSMVGGLAAFIKQSNHDSIAVHVDEARSNGSYDEMGIEFTEAGGGLKAGEELFQSYVITHLPTWREVINTWAKVKDENTEPSNALALKAVLGPLGATMKMLIDKAERSYVTLLNLQRIGLADNFLKNFPNATKEQKRQYGRLINAYTGRGNMKPSLAAEASVALFAPRFAYSRFEVPATYITHVLGATYSESVNMIKRAGGKRGIPLSKQTPVALQATRDIGGMIAMGLTTLALFSAASEAGLFGDEEEIKVGTDPESSDFGKIVVGNTRFDIWGGFQQPASLVVRSVLGVLDNRGIRKATKRLNPWDLTTRFALYKTSPAITLAGTAAFGETVVGEQVTFPQAVMQSFTSLWIQDTAEAIKSQEGWTQTGMVALATNMGIGASTYGNELDSSDMVDLFHRLDMRAPPAPRFNEEIMKNKKLKQEFTKTYEAMLADRLRGVMKILNEEDPEISKILVGRIAEQVRLPFNRLYGPKTVGTVLSPEEFEEAFRQ